MPDFRCKMLDERGGILSLEDVTVETLDGAIQREPKFSTRATTPWRLGVCSRSRFGPPRADCSLRHRTNLKGRALDLP